MVTAEKAEEVIGGRRTASLLANTPSDEYRDHYHATDDESGVIDVERDCRKV